VPEQTLLLITAASLGFVHTVLGPDHYIPFIAMAEARGWKTRRTLLITFLCGLGHVFSSALIGAFGLALGVSLFKLEALETARGDIAGWLLLGFGLAYTVWGVRKALKNHAHYHTHLVTRHAGKANITPWILFTIFVFGPCEPLIPVLMFPAMQGSVPGVVLITAVFGFFTIGTMLILVLAAQKGLALVPKHSLERYSHALAGGAILICGIGVQFLGL